MKAVLGQLTGERTGNFEGPVRARSAPWSASLHSPMFGKAFVGPIEQFAIASHSLDASSIKFRRERASAFRDWVDLECNMKMKSTEGDR